MDNFAVIEVDEDGVARECVLFNTQDEAINHALDIAHENEYSESDDELKNQLVENGHITDGGWTVNVLRTTRGS